MHVSLLTGVSLSWNVSQQIFPLFHPTNLQYICSIQPWLHEDSFFFLLSPLFKGLLIIKVAAAAFVSILPFQANSGAQVGPMQRRGESNVDLLLSAETSEPVGSSLPRPRCWEDWLLCLSFPSASSSLPPSLFSSLSSSLSPSQPASPNTSLPVCGGSPAVPSFLRQHPEPWSSILLHLSPVSSYTTERWLFPLSCVLFCFVCSVMYK